MYEYFRNKLARIRHCIAIRNMSEHRKIYKEKKTIKEYAGYEGLIERR